MECVKKNKNNRIVSKFIEIIENVTYTRNDIQITILGTRYSSSAITKLEMENKFTYGESFESVDPIETVDSNTDEIIEVPAGGKMQILIDYENVGSAGLEGSKYLCGDDRITLFYSSSCPNIERKYLDRFEKQAGEFEAVKLETIGKNSLDFYIAVKVGQIAEKAPDSKIIIVTKDNGYRAIKEYCKSHTELKYGITIAGSIENGIVASDGGTERRRSILENKERLSIDTEFAAYEERKRLKSQVVQKFRETEFENLTSQVLQILVTATTPRERYIFSLKSFGREVGTKVYKIIKDYDFM